MAAHILVVDDDADVLAVIAEMLRVSGFTVTAADGGVAMREILADKALLAVDAVVLDWTMTGERSAQLALHAKSLRLPVVMISGSIESMMFADEHGLQLLRKPFRKPGLLAAIHEAIDSGEFGQREA
jgi:DNA-binding response OmpR family regulator